MGAVLSQYGEDGEDHPVAYFSRKLLHRERNYATVDRECLAIVDGIRHFAVYLTGTQFTVATDHDCLQYLDSVKDAGGRRTWWTLLLQQYSFRVIHRAGTANGSADGLSRQAWKQPALTVGGDVVCRDTQQDDQPGIQPERSPDPEARLI